MEQQQRLKIESMESLIEEANRKSETINNALQKLEVQNKELHELILKRQQENELLRKRLNEKLTIIDQLKKKLQILNKTLNNPMKNSISRSSKENTVSQVKNTSIDLPEDSEENNEGNAIMLKEVDNISHTKTLCNITSRKRSTISRMNIKPSEQIRIRSNSNGIFAT